MLINEQWKPFAILGNKAPHHEIVKPYSNTEVTKFYIMILIKYLFYKWNNLCVKNEKKKFIACIIHTLYS